MSRAEPIPLAPKVLDPAAGWPLEALGPELLPRKLPPKRLVADRKAAEPFPPAPEFLPDAAGVDAEGVGAALAPALSLWRSLRLPRSCGVTIDAKFSATVKPVIRNVFWTIPPGKALAVRIPAGARPALGVGNVRRCHTQAAPPSITLAISKPINSPALEGFLGLGRTISGFGADVC